MWPRVVGQDTHTHTRDWLVMELRLYLSDTFVLKVHKRTHLFGKQIYAHANAVVIGSLIKYHRRPKFEAEKLHYNWIN